MFELLSLFIKKEIINGETKFELWNPKIRPKN